MKRENLKELGLTDDQIEAVMKAHGTVMTTVIGDKNALSTRVTELEGQLAGYSDYDTIKQENETLRAGNEELVTLRAYKEDREYGDRFATAVGDKSFVNDVTRDHVRAGFIAAAKDTANEGKSDADLLTAAIGGKEAEYFKSKVSITMTPSVGTLGKGTETDGKFKLVPYTP